MKYLEKFAEYVFDKFWKSVVLFVLTTILGVLYKTHISEYMGWILLIYGSVLTFVGSIAIRASIKRSKKSVVDINSLTNVTIRKIQDELLILKLQNKFKHVYIEKIFSDHYEPSSDFDVSKEKEYIAEELKKWWKHRENSEIDKMIDQFYISNNNR